MNLISYALHINQRLQTFVFYILILFFSIFYTLNTFILPNLILNTFIISLTLSDLEDLHISIEKLEYNSTLTIQVCV